MFPVYCHTNKDDLSINLHAAVHVCRHDPVVGAGDREDALVGDIGQR